MTPEEVLRVAEAGAAAGCKEALFTLGDKPELRYRAARDGLEALGHESTLSYLADMAKLVLEKTPLLPHLNPGVLSREDLRTLRQVSASQGMMLESASERLSAKGGPHYGSPDKRPAVRLETLRLAGEEAVPFTSGILIGIGETREERIEALLALRDLHDAHGHIQEIIVQNFRAKPGTRMAEAPEPGLDELLWTIATARILFGPEANIQAPPNLSPGRAASAGRSGNQRLGRRLPGDAGLRQSRGAVAAPRRARPRDRGGGQGAGRAAHDLSALRACGSALARSGIANARPEADRFRGPSPHGRLGDGRGRCTARGPCAGAGRRDARYRAHSGPRRGRNDPERARIGSTLPGAGRRLRCGVCGRRRAPRQGQRAAGQLRGQPQHQLHQRLLLPLPVLRLLQGQAEREPAWTALRPDVGRDRAPRARGVGSGRDRGLPTGRHSSRLHRRDLSRDLPRHQARRNPRSTSTPSRRWRSGRVRRRSAGPCPIFFRSCRRPGWARSPVRPPRSSTTKCAPSSARTRS